MTTALSIFIIEDDPIACKELTDCIEDAEDFVLLGSTNNSDIAIKYMKDYMPDIIILDLELHNGSGSGFFVLQALKQEEQQFKPYVLITTNNSSPITFDSTRQLGADFIMTKHQKDYSAKNVIDFLKIIRPTLLNNKNALASIHATTENPFVRNKRIIRRIGTELDHIGISPKAVGYQYLTEAIQLVLDNQKQNLCGSIATKYRKTEASVERAIQNAINRAWKTADIDDLANNYTARINPEKGVPTVNELVFFYANKIKNEY